MGFGLRAQVLQFRTWVKGSPRPIEGRRGVWDFGVGARRVQAQRVQQFSGPDFWGFSA